MNQPPPATAQNREPGVPWRWLLLVAVVALALRLFGLENQSLWFDEIIAFDHSRLPYAELPQVLRTSENTKPPLYYMVLHEWLKLGTSDAWLRMPSALSGAVACVLAALVGGQLFGRFGWVAGLCLAVSPLHVWYSQEARMYALLTMMGFAALWFHLRFLRTLSWLDLAGYTLFALLSCYTFTYGVFIFGFCVPFTLLYRPTPAKATLVKVVAASGVAFAGFLPWGRLIAAAAAAGDGFQALSKGPVYEAAGYTVFALGLGTSFGPSTDALRVHKSAIFSAQPVAAGLMILGLLLVGALLVAGAVQLWKRERNAFWFATLGGLVFWGAPAVLTLIKPGIAYNPRYAILALLPVAVFLVGAALPGRLRRLRLGLLAVFSACVAISLVNHYFDPAHSREDARGAARIIAAMQPPPERVIFCPDYLDRVYGRYRLSPVPSEPLKLTLADAPERLAALHGEVASAPRWVLVYGRKEYGDPREMLPPWLGENFEVQKREKLAGLEVITVGRKAATPAP